MGEEKRYPRISVVYERGARPDWEEVSPAIEAAHRFYEGLTWDFRQIVEAVKVAFTPYHDFFKGSGIKSTFTVMLNMPGGKGKTKVGLTPGRRFLVNSIESAGVLRRAETVPLPEGRSYAEQLAIGLLHAVLTAANLGQRDLEDQSKRLEGFMTDLCEAVEQLSRADVQA